MKQVLQNVKSGDLTVSEVPPPAVLPGMVKIKTVSSLISAGTEKMLIELANKSLAGMARARPDLVRQVVQKAQKEGVVNTFKNVMSKLEKPMPLGYSASGIVVEVSGHGSRYAVGDRVAVAGAGYANHAEVNVVPENLVAAIPSGVSFEQASYVTVASIALQGIRLGKPELGENVAVIGLGLIGLIAVQLLKANGCRVIGFDIDPAKVELARNVGADEAHAASGADAAQLVDRFTGGRGADQTLVTAATKSNAPIDLAGEITRRKGQVVVVGAVGMDIPRTTYYHKELELKVSMSYGPGRYDESYEEGGIDYPYDYVRWTEQRNMEAVLQQMATGALDVDRLTSHTFPIENALDGYDMIKEGSEPYIGILLSFDPEREHAERVDVGTAASHVPTDKLGVSFVGAGNYAALHLIPHVASNPDAVLAGLMTATGLNAQQKAEKFGFSFCTTDLETVTSADGSDAVFIATRHSTHADYTVAALEAGKHVFVEKPVAVTPEQLDAIIAAYKTANAVRPTGLMVGLNRRFAPMVTELKEAFSGRGPLQMVYRVNSGHIPTTTWL